MQISHYYDLYNIKKVIHISQHYIFITLKKFNMTFNKRLIIISNMPNNIKTLNLWGLILNINIILSFVILHYILYYSLYYVICVCCKTVQLMVLSFKVFVFFHVFLCCSIYFAAILIGKCLFLLALKGCHFLTRRTSLYNSFNPLVTSNAQ